MQLLQGKWRSQLKVVADFRVLAGVSRAME